MAKRNESVGLQLSIGKETTYVVNTNTGKFHRPAYETFVIWHRKT